MLTPKTRKPLTADAGDWSGEELKAVNLAIDTITFASDAKPVRGPARGQPAIERILVAVDGSPASRHAVAWAKELAPIFGAQVTVVLVLAPERELRRFAKRAGWEPGEADLIRKDRENGERAVTEALDTLKAARIRADAILRRGLPAPELARVAQNLPADLVILGSHEHSGRERRSLGSVADGVKNSVTGHVLITKGEFRRGSVLVPVDGSSSSRAAATLGMHIARRWKGRSTLLHVFEVPLLGYESWGAEEFERILGRMELPKGPTGTKYHLDFGKTASRILAHVDAETPALVVMGSRGMGGLRSLVAGSVSNRIAHEAHSSVLLVKRTRR